MTAAKILQLRVIIAALAVAIFGIEVSAVDSSPVSESIAHVREASETNEASCVLALAKQILDKGKHWQADYSGIELEKNVYYQRAIVRGATRYTVYGKSEKIYPHDFKIQLDAKYGQTNGKLTGCKIAGPITLYNSDGEAVGSYVPPKFDSFYDQDFYLVRTAAYEKKAREKQAPGAPHPDFNKEKGYGGKSGSKQSMEIVLDREQLNKIILKEGGGFVTDMVASKMLNRAKNLKRGMRFLRVGAKGLLVLDRAGHVVSAYDAVKEGSEPKAIAVTDFLKKEKLQEYLDIGTSVLADTGVLRPPGSYLEDFDEEPQPHKAAQAQAVKTETHASTPPPVIEIPVTNNALKSALDIEVAKP